MSADSIPQVAGVRIAHLIETDIPGGAERMLASLAGALVGRGCPGIAFLPRGGQGWLTRELRSMDVPVEYFRLEQPFSPTFTRQLASAFRRHRVDIAHSHEFTLAFYGAWAARIVRIPHVITMHGGRYYAGRMQRRVAMRLAVASSGSTVAVSRDLADHMRRDLLISRRRIEIIPNGVASPPPVQPTLRRDLGISASDPLILSVGSLYPVKGHRFLVDAMALLVAQFPTAHLAIAGRGELAPQLLDQTRALGLRARVHLLGLRTDIPGLLADADVFVLPSLAEGLPLALLEAMFAARPIVATDVGDVRLVLDHDAGVVVTPGDSPALASAISGLLSNTARAREIGGRAASRAVSQYGLERMVDRYAGIYAKLLRRPPNQRLAARS